MTNCNKGTSLLAVLVVAALSGCGGSDIKKFPVAIVKGRVICDGKPLSSASVLFNPITEGKSAVAGKQGFANTNDKGEFVLSTYGDRDGAVIGKHGVVVAGDAKVTCDCIAIDTREVMQFEVKPDVENSIEIVLPKKVGNQRIRKSSSDDD